ncbi:tRNA lysidine(34) synthetase TilS [Rhizobium sp. AG855]|uniref:tRNA lysidine(34) synthetase TilS n=1 Tax=Rhizobium sp. AG855 TaxID=2183898 RepID=UPI000FEDCF1F|nr:tRNA lysidine(34) synthetase TilS [Rhizobium sp. AG855]RKE83827.1 tRNA(Ile)-lysidine synthase [Rhizobium sp. AG855]
MLTSEKARPSVLPEPRLPDAAAHAFLSALKKPTRLLVAISGGSDSTGLLLALKQALETANHPLPHSLCAVTVDHRLRADSTKEARAVKALCERLSIPHRILEWTGEKPRSGLSAAARNARYGLLAQAADTLAADAVVTGHTLDDQVETIAMRAERSTEAALGLSGMACATLYERRLWVLRPFLQTTREAIRTFLTDAGETWIDDPSNDDTRSERVRIRNLRLEPDLAAITGAGQARRELSAQAAGWIARHARPVGMQAIQISLADTPAPTEAVRHALSTLAAILGGRPHRPAKTALDRLTTHLAKTGDFALTLSGCLIVRRKANLFLTRERRGLLPLPLPAGERRIWDGRYEIANHAGTDLIVTPGPSMAIAADLPHRMRTAMLANSPHIRTSEGKNDISGDDFAITPRLSLFDPFLPDFELALADGIARLLDREPAIACPV